MLEFQILGPLEVADEHGPVQLGGPKQRATLAILLLSANRVVSVDRLAEDLYAGAPPVTAVTQVQRQISGLRKALGDRSVIETRSPGYVLRLAPGELDLERFERTTDEASRALARGEAELGADLLRDALRLWRGAPLADLAYESFTKPAIDRLEEIRLAALERRIDADLALGRHAELVPELEQLIAEHRLRERLHGQLMLALYRSGRQVEALDVYRRMRAVLGKEFGIEPASALRDLERAILTQDRSLDRGSDPPLGSAAEPARMVLVLPSGEDRLDRLLAIAEPLTKRAGRELIIARLLADEGELSRAAAALKARTSSLDPSARTAVFTTVEPASDLIRLATTYEAELALLDSPPGLEADQLPAGLAVILEHSPADTAVLVGSGYEPEGAGVFVPFGGGEHDWAALELGAWLASTRGVPLRLVGTKADPKRGQRDASRLLADASLAVQRVAGVTGEPLLAEPTDEGLLSAVEFASLVVIGLSPRWQTEGLGEARRALVRQAHPSVLLVHRGPRPGGLAPRETRTRFTWSIEA